MLLRSIKMTNFRQYKDVRVDFSTDKEKNITVILGQNTGGKTTLVKAFLWCFYGKSKDSEFESKVNLNEHIKQEMIRSSSNSDVTVSVMVDLLYNGTEYRIERSEKYTRQFEKIKKIGSEVFHVYTIDEIGRCIPTGENDKSRVINRILPQDLSNYFFFWGERISRITNTRNLKLSMDSFFGLSALENTKKSLEKVREVYQGKAVIGGEDSILEKIQNDLQELNKNKNKTMEIINQMDMNLTSCENKLLDLHDKKLSMATMSEKIKNKNQLEQFVEISKSSKLSYYSDFQKEFNNPRNYVPYYTKNIIQKALDTLNDVSSDVSGWAHITTRSIDEIIQKQKCVCGTVITKGSQEFNNLLNEISLMPPKSIGALIDDFKRIIKSRDKYSNEYVENLNKIWQNIINDEDNISDYEEEIKKLKSEVDEDLRTTIESIDKNIIDINKKIKVFSDKRDSCISTLAKIDSELESKGSSFKELTKKYKNSEKYNILLEYTDALLEVCSIDLEKGKKLILENLNKYVAKHFKKMYHGDRTISIDEKFNVELSNTLHGNIIKMDQSEGLMAVKNFSFISGMIEMAREKLPINENHESLNSEPCPIVLDAPFSHTDETHIPNICKQLCSVAEQTILVVMEKDWNYAKEIMQDKVGQYYIIDKQSEFESKIVERESN